MASEALAHDALDAVSVDGGGHMSARKGKSKSGG